jgi:protein-disulfide isomerase
MTLGVLCVATACRETSATPKQVVEKGEPSADVPEVLASIGAEKITLADVRERSGAQLAQVETQYRMLRSSIIQAALDSILRERVLGAEAKRQGQTIDGLVAKTTASVPDPSDADIQDWYNANQDRTGGRTLEQLRSQIRDFLRTQRQGAAVDSMRSRLNAEQKVVVNFEPYRVAFNNEGAPTIGRENATVTLVEFSDFQCPYCHAVWPTLKLIEKNFGDKVRIIYRQSPIPSLHPFAFKAAEASLCAQEQGKFWEMHDAMFGDQKKLAVSDLKQTARRLGMDGKQFDKCLDTGKSVERVQNDMAEAQRAGVKGTPALFVNGVEIKGGAVSYDIVAREIQKALLQTKG